MGMFTEFLPWILSLRAPFLVHSVSDTDSTRCSFINWNFVDLNGRDGLNWYIHKKLIGIFGVIILVFPILKTSNLLI